jgi:hypothetical protein
MISQVIVVTVFWRVFCAPAQADLTRVWTTVSELSEAERADIEGLTCWASGRTEGRPAREDEARELNLFS